MWDVLDLPFSDNIFGLSSIVVFFVGFYMETRSGALSATDLFSDMSRSD